VEENQGSCQHLGFLQLLNSGKYNILDRYRIKVVESGTGKISAPIMDIEYTERQTASISETDSTVFSSPIVMLFSSKL
jgi:hypothetical protein